MPKYQVAGVDEQICFLFGLAAHRFARRFIAVYVAGDDAVLSDFAPGVEPLQEQYSSLVFKEKVDFRDEPKASHLGCFGCAA